MYENMKIFILGMARSGYEAAKLLSSKNEIVITDSKNQDTDKVKELENLGVKVIITDEQMDYLDETFDLVIKNPGIRLDNECVLKALKLGIEVVNEVEVAYNMLPESNIIIGVTGSNGKTTTTKIIYDILKSANCDVYLGGNIGYPLCSLVNKVNKNSILVLEISNLQLCNIKNFKTNISILTNITPTHLDFHSNFEEYKNIKKRIFNNHTCNDLAILNKENDDVLDITKDILSKKVYFSSKQNSDCCLKEDGIYYQDELVIEYDDILIKGNHNYENIMSAIICVKQFSIKNDIIRKVLKTFSGVEHRLEYVSNINDVTYYNDSKATNPTSTHIALTSFAKPIIILMGGMDRQENFEDLKKDMNYVKQILCYGETKDKIKEFADKHNIKCEKFINLQEATNEAIKIATPGDIVLLSPSCASWDQFNNFEERGDEFKRIINNLGGIE